MRIKALDPDVVHKIAAGEIIVRPSNALKELIENSIDAGATRVDVLVKEGGLKMLQITDNGHGIDPEDFPLLCQRFATSKLKDAADLESIATLGFRGEALASISHVSHLSVKTKTQDSCVANQAHFLNGELVEGTQKKLAGVNGTQITVMDLFYNSRHRLEVFDKRKPRTEEYHRILETVQKYAILYSHVSFSVKRAEDTQPVVILGKTAKDRIKAIYEINTQDLLALELETGSEVFAKLGLISATGFATGLNFAKKSADSLVVFINNRLVSNSRLASAIRNVYTRLMPSNSVHYFVYLNLQIEPQNVDVNVHPTKREVRILHQDEIIGIIAQRIEELLTRTDDTRDFRVQSYISSTTLPSEQSPQARLSLFEHSSVNSPRSQLANSQPRYEYNLVRTDPKQQTLAPFVRSNKPSKRNMRRAIETDSQLEESNKRRNAIDTDESSSDNDMDVDDAQQDKTGLENEFEESEHEELPTTPIKPSRQPSKRHESPIKNLKSFREYKEINLLSVQSLLAEVRALASPELLRLIAEHTFVGIVDAKRGLSAVQWDVRLYLIDHRELSSQMFYQIVLTQFGNFGTIHLGDGLSIEQLLALNPGFQIEDGLIDRMGEMAPMLLDYFQIELKFRGEWVLVQLPLLLPEYAPPTSRIPHFMAQLAAVDWVHERECIQGIARALATLYVPSNTVTRTDMMHIFDRAKFGFVPTYSLRSSITEIANLPGLYRVFERC